MKIVLLVAGYLCFGVVAAALMRAYGTDALRQAASDAPGWVAIIWPFPLLVAFLGWLVELCVSTKVEP